MFVNKELLRDYEKRIYYLEREVADLSNMRERIRKLEKACFIPPEAEDVHISPLGTPDNVLMNDNCFSVAEILKAIFKKNHWKIVRKPAVPAEVQVYQGGEYVEKE